MRPVGPAAASGLGTFANSHYLRLMLRATIFALALATPLGAGAGEMIANDLTALPRADVVILGELHDNPAHHANQAVAVAALRPAALVFEMLTPEQAARITPENRTDAKALGTILGWEAAGWPDFAMYFPVFAAAPEAAIHGAAVPRADAMRVLEQGLAASFGEDATRYGLDRPLSPDAQAEREAEQAEAHCDALPPDMLPGMVEVQRLRDAVLARTAAEALAETGGPVAVITGNGHARVDRGVPLFLRRAAPDATVLSLGQIEARPGPGEAPPYDLWLVTAPAERGDPCAAFR